MVNTGDGSGSGSGLEPVCPPGSYRDPAAGPVCLACPCPLTSPRSLLFSTISAVLAPQERGGRQLPAGQGRPGGVRLPGRVQRAVLRAVQPGLHPPARQPGRLLSARSANTTQLYLVTVS